MAPRFQLYTLGGMRIDRIGSPAPETVLADSRSLFIPALLATRDRYTARRDELAELLWPQGDRRRSLRALRQALFYLSRHADGILVRDGDTLRLDPEVVDVDLWRFEAAVAARDDRAVVDLYRGRFAAGLEPKAGRELELWIDSVDARLSVAVEVSYTRAIATALTAREYEDAVRLAKRFSALNPLDEFRHRRLVETLTAAGQDVQALQALEEFRRQTADEDEPDEEESAHLADVRRQLLEAARTVRPAPPPASPEHGPHPSRHSNQDLPRPRSRRARWLTFAAGTAVGLAAATLLVARLRERPPIGPLSQLDAGLFVTAGTGTQAQLLRIDLDGKGVRIAPSTAFRPGEIPSPDRRAVGTTVPADDGWNVAVRTLGTGAIDTITTAAGDEEPVGWSPDGRHLLYRHARLLDDGSTREFTLHLVDRLTGERRTLTPGVSHQPPTAAWVPSGAKLAFTADVRGAPDVFVMDFDGGNLHNLTTHLAWDGAPTWSPGGAWLAFLSDRDGERDLYVARPDGSDLRRVARTPARETSVTWLNEEVLLALAETNGDRDLYAVHPGSGEVRRLTDRGDLVAIVAPDAPPAPWIDTLRITPRPPAGSPGQHLTFTAQLVDTRGNAFSSERVPIEWSLSDTSLARLDDSGRVVLDRPGRIRLVASAAGWRSDTLSVYSLPLVIQADPPVLAEDWSGGLDSLRWRPFGDPVPRTSADGGPDGGGVLRTSGDEYFASGVIGRSAIAASEGIAVEVAGRLPFTGKLHQEFGVALYDLPVPDSVLQADRGAAVVELRIRGPTAESPAEAWVATTDRREPLPLPDRLDRWQRYALQITGDGVVEVLIDGRMYWRSPFTIPERHDSLFVGLGFQSFDADLLHGPVTVYPHPRYHLPDTLSVQPAL